MNTPILATDRLWLRPFNKDDAQTVFECWESDPDVAKNTGERAIPPRL